MLVEGIVWEESLSNQVDFEIGYYSKKSETSSR